MKLLIAGDLVPTESNADLFSKADLNTLLGEELLKIWKSADERIFNLEVPLINICNPIEKCGPNLASSTDTINGIKALNPSCITLANNHILDQGTDGLRSTELILSKNNISFVGVGDNLKEASKPYVIDSGDIKVGIYACAENEFSIATDISSGANPFDPLESLDHINKLKQNCDYVIVLYHGGKEHYRYPSPYLQKVCRKIVQKGADLVVCQHSHCIGCFEEFENSVIVYGQGNFIFDDSESEFWKTSLIIDVIFDREMKVNYIPILKKDNLIRLADKEEAQKILNCFNQRSEKILDRDFIGKEYKKFAKENFEYYLKGFSGNGKWISRIDRYVFNGLILKSKYNNDKLLKIRNYIECEAHKELVIEAIKYGLNKNKL